MRHLVGASLAVVTLPMISTVSAQTANDKIRQVKRGWEAVEKAFLETK